MTSPRLGRRSFMLGAASLSALALAGCASGSRRIAAVPVDPRASIPPDVLAMYGAMPEEQFPIPAARIELVDPMYWRQEVADPTGERPGTVVVDTANRFLYHVAEGGRAMRYGVGIGRDGFSWSGRARIAYKRKWPTWTPPAEMIAREPYLEPYRRGMPPGIENPLGARALYIFEGGRDTIYRLHGNPDERSIGQAVSSGCVRLLNQDVIDLYNRVKDGSPILVA
ncbi:Lipoprotein-anchoring transpeptidase ErfK/SrfK [Devosia enhydra]|uniref:Lipoprotein-anchoring transpeptidase ErfK/SrfK n=1 Tax=Devosia enhydra TaxID=665118 RepID=A0A1K2HZ64_9HYPH|nr:L,D-transpeptidase [Devosia enhydra]SFZ85371.1 Lipoprotein-anchoring transpeptidase ErfK/SrfK [Devosia enhydra]